LVVTAEGSWKGVRKPNRKKLGNILQPFSPLGKVQTNVLRGDGAPKKPWGRKGKGKKMKKVTLGGGKDRMNSEGREDEAACNVAEVKVNLGQSLKILPTVRPRTAKGSAEISFRGR